MFYKLDRHKKVVECSLAEAMRFAMDMNKKSVAQTRIGNIEISTVFLCIRNPSDGGLFETMIFDLRTQEPLDMVRRYETFDEARECHFALVKIIQDHVEEFLQHQTVNGKPVEHYS